MNEVRLPEAAGAARALLRAFLAETERLLRPSASGACRPIHIALSGGQTAFRLFDVWAREFADCTPWQHLHFYWADERCVPPAHPESNYGGAVAHGLSRMPVPPGHVHRIRGEADPAAEAARYAALVARRLPVHHGVPCFHFVWLGMGPDGHTASVFPGSGEEVWRTAAPYAVSIHPQTGQRRITLTGRPLLQALHTWFLVTGADKQGILNRIRQEGADRSLPAARVLRTAREARLFVSER